jgi:predicted transcriptional regulator
MGNNEELERLLFELASENRLSILRELKNESLRMQEIARRLEVTPTEVFRQLERLSAASLVQRKPDGTFRLAEYGKLVLQLLSSLDFVSKNRDYFSTHELMMLPIQLLNRLGELSQGHLGMDTIENLNKGEKAFTEAEEYGWGIGEGIVPENMGQVMQEKVQRGIQLKLLLPEKRLQANANTTEMAKNVEVKGLSDLPAIAVLTEKTGGICFRQIGGRMDYSGFFGDDPLFLNWVKDLFQYYWKKEK